MKNKDMCSILPPNRREIRMCIDIERLPAVNSLKKMKDRYLILNPNYFKLLFFSNLICWRHT